MFLHLFKNGECLMSRRKLTPYLFLVPGCTILGAFIFYLMLRPVWLSLIDYNMIQDAGFIGFDNYTYLFQADLFWKTLLNTVIYLVGLVPALVIIPIFLAVLVNQKLKGVGFFRSDFFIPGVKSL